MKPHSLRQQRLLCISLLLGMLIVLIAIAGSILLLYISVALPDVGDAEARVTQILDAHGGVEAKLSPSAKVAQAVVAIEDRRFYVHHGIDTISLLRVALAVLTTGSASKAGGATITEQLAKALYIPDDDSIAAKLQIMGLAIKLETSYSKAEILTMYLNAIYFGDGQWGVAQASRAYFGKAPEDLDWAQASLLAGLPQAPSVYDPTRDFDLARRRQKQVFSALVSTGVLTKAQAQRDYTKFTSLRH